MKRVRFPKSTLARVLLFLLMGFALFSLWRFTFDTPQSDSPNAVEKSKENDKKNSGSAPPPPVQFATVTQQDVPRFLFGLGTVTAENTVTVQSQVSGQLQSLHFSEGQTVNAGQLLAEIDPRAFQIQLLQAQGALATAQATLNNAKRDLARYQSLIKTNLITHQQRDTQQALVTQNEGQVKTAQAAVENAQLQLTYSRITAPISGKVGLKQIDAGNIINTASGMGIVVITQVQPINVLFTLPESNLAFVNQAQNSGKPVPVEAWDRTNQKRLASGTLKSIDNQIDSTTGTVKLKAQFSNQDNALFPNQFVNARINVETLHNALVIPIAAVQLGNEGHFVWLLNDENKVTKQRIDITLQNEQIAVIPSGLQVGQRVITDGVDQLVNEMKVDVVDPNKTANTVRQKP